MNILEKFKHEFFKKVLCNLFGKDSNKCELLTAFDMIGETTRDITCFNPIRRFSIDSERA